MQPEPMMHVMPPARRMSRLHIALIVLAAIVLFFVALYIGSAIINKNNPAAPSAYSAVYLSTGDIYFGELSWFPIPTLRNVWYLQRTTDETGKPTVGIAPLTGAFWGPIDSVRLNPKDVVLVTRLRNDSQVTKALANPASLTPAVQPQPAAQRPTPQPSSTEPAAQ